MEPTLPSQPPNEATDGSIPPKLRTKTDVHDQFRRYIEDEEEASDGEELPPIILKGRFASLNTIAMSEEYQFAITTACNLYNYFPAEPTEPNRLKFSKHTILSIDNSYKDATGSTIESTNHFIASYWSPRLLYKLSGRSLLLVISSEECASLFGPRVTGTSAAPLDKIFDFAPPLTQLYEDNYFNCSQSSLLTVTAGAWSEITPGKPTCLIALSHLAGFITLWRITQFSVEFLAKVQCDQHSSDNHTFFNLLKISSWNESSCLLAASSTCGTVLVYDIELQDNPEFIYPKATSLEFVGIRSGQVGIGLLATLSEEDDCLISCMEWQSRANGTGWLGFSKPTKLILCELSKSTPPLMTIHPHGHFPIVGLMWIIGGSYLLVIDYEGTYDGFEVVKREDSFLLQSLHNIPAFAIHRDGLKSNLSRVFELGAYKEDDEEDDDVAVFSSCNKFLRVHGAVASKNGFQIFIHYSALTGLMDYSIPSTESTFFIGHDLTPFLQTLECHPQLNLFNLNPPEENTLLYQVLLNRLLTLDEHPQMSLETLLWDLIPTPLDLTSDSSPPVLFVENILNLELQAWSSQSCIPLAKSLSRVVVYLYHRFRKLGQLHSSQIPLVIQRLNAQSSCSFATLLVYHTGQVKHALDTFSSSNSDFPLVSGDILNQTNQVEFNLGLTLSKLLGVLSKFSTENSPQVKYARDHAIEIQKSLKKFHRSPVREVCQVCFNDIPFGNFLHTACTKVHKMTWDRCQLTFRIITSPVNLNCTNCGITLDSNHCGSRNPHSIFSRAFVFHFFTMGLRKIGKSGWRCPHCYGLLF